MTADELLEKYSEGQRDFRGISFEEVDLHEADLSRIHLEDAELIDVNLCGAVLKNAHLDRAKFIRTNLSSADLSGANLEWAWLNNSRLQDANLLNANLAGASLKNSDLVNANLEKTSLDCANLSSSDLTGANLEGASLCEADLSFTTLIGVNLTFADMTDTRMHGVVRTKNEPTTPAIPRHQRSHSSRSFCYRLGRLVQGAISGAWFGLKASYEFSCVAGLAGLVIGAVLGVASAGISVIVPYAIFGYLAGFVIAVLIFVICESLIGAFNSKQLIHSSKSEKYS